MALLLAGCASFQPVKDATAGPYHAPPGSNSAAYEGIANKLQDNYIKRATFPKLTATERALMIEVNRNVNEDITYMTDEDNYGLMDLAVEEPRSRHPRARGMPTARYGDCEDYALTKKHRLANLGMDLSRLFVVRAMVPTSAGFQRHVVLAVPEGSDWWILNNWDNRIEPASLLTKWWDWNFCWPAFDEYQRIAKMRSGGRYDASSAPRGAGTMSSLVKFTARE